MAQYPQQQEYIIVQQQRKGFILFFTYLLHQNHLLQSKWTINNCELRWVCDVSYYMKWKT